jgi:hypothetical protein
MKTPRPSENIRRRAGESPEQAIARVRAFPTLLDELSPEAVASIQRRASEEPEVLGRGAVPRRESR